MKKIAVFVFVNPEVCSPTQGMRSYRIWLVLSGKFWNYFVIPPKQCRRSFPNYCILPFVEGRCQWLRLYSVD